MNSNSTILKKKRGRPSDPQKMLSIISTAQRLFAENGFERTTIDAIADMSGVTKMTIYSHFKSKEELFGATIFSRVENEFLVPDRNLDPKNPHDGLTMIAKQFVSLIRKDEVLGSYRTMFASTSTHPELCNTFYQNGPVKVHREVSEYLNKCSAAGSLNITDFDSAATQLLSLFLGLDHTKCLLGLGKPSKTQDDDLILRNVEFFIKASL
jgi:TetR/AcrR family transcriptional regulator, mexJK operon transcriptional repressor